MRSQSAQSESRYARIFNAKRRSSPDGRRGHAGLLPPTLFVHADDEEPRDVRDRPEKTDDGNVGEQLVSERRREEHEPTQTSNQRQHTQSSREEEGPDNEVAFQD